jgi:hypothetical protein
MLAISTSASAQGVQCMPCLAGTYAAAGSTSCTPCPAGKYCPSGASAPHTCPAGYAPDSTKTSCVICGAGTYAAAGATECKPCPAETYQPNIMVGSPSSCKPCPAGTTSSVGASACIKCASYTAGPIPGDKGYFNYSNSFIYCKPSGDSCVLDSSQQGSGCYGNYSINNISNYYGCSAISGLRWSAGHFCANGGSF